MMINTNNRWKLRSLLVFSWIMCTKWATGDEQYRGGRGFKKHSRNEMACFEFPIVIMKPHTPLPTVEACHAKALPPPGLDCMKFPVQATLQVFDNPNGQKNCIHLDDEMAPHVTTTLIYDNITVAYRGASSLYIPKNQMAITFQDDVSFLGQPSNHKWVLNGPWFDGSMLRNHLGHWLYRQTGRYSPRTRHVILFIQEPASNDKKGKRSRRSKLSYRGLYLLLEKIGFGPNRVGLAQNDKNCGIKDMSGGWAWQYNPLRYGDFSPNFVMDQYQQLFGMGERPLLEYPHGASLTQTMRDYVVSQERGFLPLYYRYLFHNMTQTENLEKHIDLGSFVDYMLHTEMSRNQDAYKRSVWFFKDRNQPINAGPVWDLNLAYGMGASSSKEDWLFTPHISFKRLICNYKIASMMIRRWKELRKGPWSTDSIQIFLRGAAEPIQEMIKRCPHKELHSNKLYCLYASDTSRESFQSQIHSMEKSMIERMEWMDKNIDGLYQALDNKVCGSAGEIPKYNCAADPNDSGCLARPDEYASKVAFPILHQPYQGGKCASNVLGDHTVHYTREPSIDPCWFSTGKYVMTASYLTPFCSGHGACEGGMDQTCKCQPKYHGFACNLSSTPGDTGTGAGLIMAAVIPPSNGPISMESKHQADYFSYSSVYMYCWSSVLLVAGIFLMYRRNMNPRKAYTRGLQNRQCKKELSNLVLLNSNADDSSRCSSTYGSTSNK